MTKIKVALRQVLTDPNATHQNTEEFLRLLLDLKEPADEVLRDFLEGRKTILTKMLTEFDATKTITQVRNVTNH